MKTKDFCDVVRHSTIAQERLREIECFVSSAAALTEKYHPGPQKISRMDFYVDFVRNFCEGKDVTVLGVTIPRSDAEVMMAAKEFEGELLAGFSRMITGLTNKASRKYGIPADDMFGEAYKAFLNAFVNYNGTTRFSTYLYTCVRRHFSKVCGEGSMVRIPREVRRLTMRVVDRMQKERVSFDDAVSTEGLPREKVQSLVAAMAKVNSASELKIKESDMVLSVDKKRISGVLEAVESVKLGRLEKAVVKGFLEAPTGSLGLSKGCEGMINPNTGRPYTRASISAAWKQARKKLAKALKDVA
jgi:hypothetical protein